MKRILVCEKNEFFKNNLIQIIRCRFPDVEIKWVLNSEQCLAETGDFKPHILFLGVNVYTGNNELDILEKLRDRCPAVNIILFTDYGIEEYRKEAILRGANYIIPKESWTGNEILALMKTILASNRGNDNGPDEIPAATIDLLKKPLDFRKKDARGKAAEQEYLARNPGRRKNNSI